MAHMNHQAPSMTTGEAARTLRVSLKTIQQWVDRGLLECWKTPGGHRRIKTASLELLQSRLSRWRHSPVRIVVVTGNEHHLSHRALQRISTPAEIHVAADGVHALLHCARTQPDLLLCEEPLPGVDCATMMRALRKDSQLQDMRIMLVTDASAIASHQAMPGIRCIDKAGGDTHLHEALQAELAELQQPPLQRKMDRNGGLR